MRTRPLALALIAAVAVGASGSASATGPCGWFAWAGQGNIWRAPGTG